MGEKKNRLLRFKEVHPYCCLCGGSVLTESIEHAPPRVMYWSSHRPKGMEVPSCKRCNEGSKDYDQAAAFLCKMQSPKGYGGMTADEEEDFTKLGKAIFNNFPDLARVLFNLQPTWRGNNYPGNPDGAFQLAPFIPYVHQWAAKQTYATWYELTSNIISSNGIVLARYFSGAEAQEAEDIRMMVTGLGGHKYLEHGKWETEDQFLVKFSYNADEGFGVFAFIVHDASILVCMVIDNKKLIEGMDIRRFPNSDYFMTNKLIGIHRVEIEDILGKAA